MNRVEEEGLRPSDPGSVVLDIGGDIGAAIVEVPASLAGQELEIRSCGTKWDGTHKGIRERRSAASTVYAAIFDALPAGRYQVRVRNPAAMNAPGAEPVEFDVQGGAVTHRTLAYRQLSP